MLRHIVQKILLTQVTLLDIRLLDGSADDDVPYSNRKLRLPTYQLLAVVIGERRVVSKYDEGYESSRVFERLSRKRIEYSTRTVCITIICIINTNILQIKKFFQHLYLTGILY